MTPAPPRRIFFAGPMNSHAHRLRRKSVIRSVSSVHAADRAFPILPPFLRIRTRLFLRFPGLLLHPIVPGLVIRFSAFVSLIRCRLTPALRLTSPFLLCSRFRRTFPFPLRSAFPLVRTLMRAPGAGKLRIFSRRKSRRARAFFRFLPLSSRYGNKFHIFPPRFDVKNRAAIVQL